MHRLFRQQNKLYGGRIKASCLIKTDGYSAYFFKNKNLKTLSGHKQQCDTVWNLAEVILHWYLLLHPDEEGGEPSGGHIFKATFLIERRLSHTKGQVCWYYHTPWLPLWMLPRPVPPGSHQEPIYTLMTFQIFMNCQTKGNVGLHRGSVAETQFVCSYLLSAQCSCLDHILSS